VSHQPAEKLNTATLRAIESNVLQESIDGERLVFRHALIREALYAGIAPLQRRDLHRSVAEALVAEDRPDPDEIVTHLERAFDPRAMLWLVRAGDRAMTRFAWDVGVQRYERALELLERQADPDEALHGEVLLSLGEAQNRVAAGRSGAAAQPVLGAGGSYTGRDTFKRAAAVAARSGSSEQLAQAALGVVGFNPYPQQAGIEGVELLEQALEQLPPQDSLLRVQILARLSIDPYFLAANHERIPLTQELADTLLARSDEAVAMARRLDDRTALAYALVMRVMQHELRPTDEWLAAADEAVEAARAAGDASLLIWALLEKFIATERSGDVDLLRRIVDQIRPISDQLGLPIFDWEVACADAKIALAAGNLDKAERLLDAADSIQPNSGLGTYLRVVLYLEQCRHEELVHLAVQYASLFIETTEQMHVRTLEMVARWQIDPEQVDRDEFTRIATNTSGASGVKGRDYGRALAWLAELCAAIDAVDEAAIVYDALLTVADENVSGATKYTGGSTHQYLGLLATTLERWDAAGEHFEQALARNEEWGYRLHAAYTRYGWATMLLHRGRAGDSSRAHELLNEARAEAREIGSVRLLRRIEELAPSSSGGKMPYPAGLTQREVEVLQQVARGLTDAEIAEELYISPRTVSQHLRNSYNKLGVNNRAEATRFAVEQGIA
jgi:DNA-binding CsgD family transcriptional regulator